MHCTFASPIYMFVTQMLNFILHVLGPRFSFLSHFWQFLEKKHIPVSEVELKLKKVKVTRFFSLTCYFILLRKSKILTRERKDIWQWFILGKFDTLTSIKKFSLKFFLTITMFNKNANKKKHLDIVQLLNIKYVLVKDLFFF